MALMEESMRVLFEAWASQERAWLEATMRAKMEEMRSLILDEVEWKMHPFMKLLTEQERGAGPGPGPGFYSSGSMSWPTSPEYAARLERWKRQEEELRERKRKLWEAKPSVSLQQVEVRQTPVLDPQLTDAHVKDEREMRNARERLVKEKTIENERKKMERRKEIRDRTAKLEKEQLQEERKALEKEWKNIEKEKRKIEENREELERKAKAQDQQLEKEKKRLESEAKEREEALRKMALADEQKREKIELERKKMEVEQKEAETQKEQLLEEKKRLEEKVAMERRAVAKDKQRLKDEWEKVKEEGGRVEKERKEPQRAEEINKKQGKYKALMKEMEKEKQKIETTRKKMMEEKTQRGNEEGEKKSDEVKHKTEITETAIKEEKADEVAQGKTEEADVDDDRNSWDSDESNQEESSQPKANSNIALMKAESQRSAQENEDDSDWDSDEEVATPRNTKAAKTLTIPKATVPLKSGNASKVPVKNTCTQKQSKALSDAQVVDKELEEFQKELEAMPGNGKSAAASIKKATVPVKHGGVCSAPVKKNLCVKTKSKDLVDPDLFDKELEELEEKLAASSSNSKPTAATNVQRATMEDDIDMSDDLFDTDLQERKTQKKSAKEDPVDSNAIARKLERLNYERKSKDFLNKSNSKAMTANKPTDVNANKVQNRLLFPQDAIHLKYLNRRRRRF